MEQEPKWLIWARELQAIAQSGLAYAGNGYERERYEAVRAVATQIFAAQTDADFARIAELFARERGYATPKCDVRAAVFDEAGRVLMVRERADGDRWSLPGGWADVNLSAAQNALKEVVEESGYTARVIKLAAVWDRTTQQHPMGVFSCYKVFFICERTGGSPSESIETSGVGWFAADDLPEDLSLARVLPAQVTRMFEHYAQPQMPADFD